MGRYRAQSQRVREHGRAVARTQALLEAAQVLVPGAFVVLVVWLGARAAVAGSITPGELVAFYGYAAFLTVPLRTLVEVADKVTRSLVAARRLIAVLRLEPELRDPERPAAAPGQGAGLVDGATGLVVEPGLLTAVVCDEPEAGSALADRLGRYVDADVRWDGVALADLPLAVVRRRVLVADQAPVLLSGRLRDEVGGDAARAVETACAGDVVQALPDGLDSRLDEGARGAVRRPAPAPRAGPGARGRARGARAGRADQRGRRAHRGPDRRAAGAPRGPAGRRSCARPARWCSSAPTASSCSSTAGCAATGDHRSLLRRCRVPPGRRARGGARERPAGRRHP